MMKHNKYIRFLKKSRRRTETFLDAIEITLVTASILLQSILKIFLFRIVNNIKFRVMLAIHMRGADSGLKQYLRETYDKSLLVISPPSILGLITRGSWRWRRQSPNDTST